MRKPTLLIVEDEPSIRNLLAQALEIDCVVTAVASGEEAVRTAKETPPEIILLDLNLPGMSGYDVCRTLKADARFEKTPIIFLTAHEDLDKELKGLDAGAIDYITKPINLTLLRARLRNHLALVR